MHARNRPSREKWFGCRYGIGRLVMNVLDVGTEHAELSCEELLRCNQATGRVVTNGLDAGTESAEMLRM